MRIGCARNSRNIRQNAGDAGVFSADILQNILFYGLKIACEHKQFIVKDFYRNCDVERLIFIEYGTVLQTHLLIATSVQYIAEFI